MPTPSPEPSKLNQLLDEFRAQFAADSKTTPAEIADQSSLEISREELLTAFLKIETEIRLARNESQLQTSLEERYHELSPELIRTTIERAGLEQTVNIDQEPNTIVDHLEERTLPPSSELTADSLDSSDKKSPSASSDATLPPEEATILGGASEKTGNQQPQTLPGKTAATVGPGQRNRSVVPERVFGDYELEREIARGGMGVVYQARQLKLNRTCALKMILSGNLAGEDEIQRFYAEAESAASLSHSGIVPVYEVGEIDGQHFFSMAFIAGKSLSEETANGPLDANRAATLTRDIAAAIAYAHGHGLVHRDLKPANVLIDKDGTPKITDFGLAKQVKNESGLTATGQILGTPSYMPPEQATGRTNEIDATSDIYSIGGILYCLLTGRPPFQAATPMDTLIQVMESEPVPPTRLNPRVPKDLETICLKCLNKEQHRRYASSDELVRELERFLNDEPILSRPIGRLERGWRWCKKRPLIAGLSSFAASLILFVAIAGPIIAVQQNELRLSAEQERADAKTSEAEAKRFAELATQRQREAEQSEERAKEANEQAQNDRLAALKELYGSNISLAHNEWKNNNVKHARRILARCPPELRNWEYYFLQQLVNQEAMVLQGLDRTMSISVNESRNELAAVGISGRQWVIKRYDLRTGREFDSIAQSQFISPNAQYYVSPRGDRLLLYRVEDGAEVRVFVVGNTAEVRGVAFSPDESLLAVAMPDGKSDGQNLSEIQVFNVDTGRKVATLQGVPTAFPLSRVAIVPWGYVMPLAISRDNRTLVAGSPQPPYKTQVWDLTTETMTNEFQEHLFPVFQVAISDNGELIASAGKDGVGIWNLKDDSQSISINDHLGAVYDVEFSPGGETIATGGWDRSVKVWSTVTGEELATLRGAQSAVFDLAFRDGGNQLIAACEDGDIRVWQTNQLTRPGELVPERIKAFMSRNGELDSRAQAGLASYFASESNHSEYSLVGAHGNTAQSVAISPDGRRVATAGHDGRVRIFQASTGKLLHEFESFVYVHGMQFDPTGRRLAFPNGQLIRNSNNKRVPGRGWVEIRDVESGELVKKLDVLDRPISSVGLSRDGTKLAAACGLHLQYSSQLGVAAADNKPGLVIVWDLESGEELWRTESHANMAASVSFNADDELLGTTGMDGVIRVWNANTGQLAQEIENSVANTCTFSSNGRYLAGAGFDGITRIWDASTFELEQMLAAHHGNSYMVAFTPDGTRLFSAGSDATVTVWDPEDGRELLTLRGHSAEVLSVAMNQDGSVLVSTGTTGMTKTWTGLAPELQGGDLFEELVFADDFERAEIGELWQASSPTTQLDQGRARTTLQPLQNPTFGTEFNIGSMSLIGPNLPDEIQVDFDVQFEMPMGVQVGFIDEHGWFGEYVMSLGTPKPGSGLMETEVMAQNGYVSFKTLNAVPFDGLTPNETHHFTIRRYRDRVYVEINGNEVLTSEVRTILNPRLALNSVYGPEDSHAWFDNLEIRTTRASKIRLQVRQLLQQLFDEHLIPQQVKRALQEDESLDEERIEVAISMFDEFPIDEAKLRDQMIGWTVAQKLDQPTVAKALTYAETLTSTNPSDATHQLLLGYWQLRNHDLESATQTLENAETLFLESIHFQPATMALLAVCKKDLQEEAIKFWDVAESRFRSQHWQQDELTKSIWQFAKKELESPELPERSSDKQLLNRLANQVTAAQQALFFDNDLGPLRELMSEDCEILMLEAGTGDGIEFQLDRDAFLDGERALLAEAKDRRLEYSELLHEVNDEGVQLEWTLIYGVGNSAFKLQQTYFLTQATTDWEITRFSTQFRYRKDARETIDYLVDKKEINRQLEEALANGDKQQIVDRYSQASHTLDALRVAKELAAESPDNPFPLVQSALYAQFAYDVDTFLELAIDSLKLFKPSQERPKQDVLLTIVRTMIKTERFEQLNAFFSELDAETSREKRFRWKLLREAGLQLSESYPDESKSTIDFWNRHLDDWMGNDDEIAPKRSRLLDWMSTPSHWTLIGVYPSDTDFRGYDRVFAIESLTDDETFSQIIEKDQLTTRTISIPRGSFADLREEMSDQENGVVFAYAEVVVDAPVEVEILLGSDDGFKFFHDGKLVESARVHRAWTEGRNRFPILLHEGTNHFMLKIDQAGGGWGFSFDICDSEGWPIQVDWQPSQ